MHRLAGDGNGLSSVRRVHVRFLAVGRQGSAGTPLGCRCISPIPRHRTQSAVQEPNSLLSRGKNTKEQDFFLLLLLLLPLLRSCAQEARAPALQRSPCAAARRRRKARRGARMDAREFVVSTWTCCRQTPQPPREPDFAGTQNQARRRGVLLFGYFLLDKQEKVTRPPLRGTKLAKSQLQSRGKRNASIRRNNRENRNASKSLDSRLRGNDEV
jgi:hypothetical protein